MRLDAVVHPPQPLDRETNGHQENCWMGSILSLCGDILILCRGDVVGWRIGGSRTTSAAISLNAAGAQAENAITLERALPSEELGFRHVIAPTRILDCDYAAGHRRHDCSFAAGHPPQGARGRQLDHGCDLTRATALRRSARLICRPRGMRAHHLASLHASNIVSSCSEEDRHHIAQAAIAA